MNCSRCNCLPLWCDQSRDAAGKSYGVMRGPPIYGNWHFHFFMRSHKYITSMFTVSIVVSEHFMLLPVALFSLRISRLIHTIAINNKAFSYQGCTPKGMVEHSLDHNPDRNVCHSTPHRPWNKFTLPTHYLLFIS